ncbi:hypothetical protein [Chryseobacterium sp. ERMR1:04]|uniref:hypothetical protein n=1 Tax=Chryseobacterium sp. ERMR1:04 TaxID=1705393 RepID=UPI0006C88B30|nr:hypothetical protein [Chryseobacterium sp. ERMR1:04]KPH12038.1 hypothetical protein AMQ68_22135 [Chryseobacterium sp. ERMR1:04]
MKNVVFGILVVLFALLSCKREDDDSIQKIDQILDLYMKNNAGQDLLNGKKAGSFSSYAVNDIFGDADNSPVSIPLKMTSDSLFYMEYITGAKRKILDSVSPENRTYYSRLALSLRRTVNNVADTVNDVVEIQYHWTPTVFEVSKVYYNGTLRFTKQPGGLNVVTIVK